jgi:ethanolamine ammonia-lyase small subunit
VITPIDWTPIEAALIRLGLYSHRVDSAAADRDTYLRRPDLGRRLNPASRQRLAQAASGAPGLLILVADGLSSTGVAANAVEVIAELLRSCARVAGRLRPWCSPARAA